MTDNSFDKFIKEKLNNFSSPVPDGLWEKIAQEKDRKPVGAFGWKNYGLIFTGITAMLLCTTLFINNSNTKDASPVSTSQQALGHHNNKSDNAVQANSEQSLPSASHGLAQSMNKSSDNNFSSQLSDNDYNTAGDNHTIARNKITASASTADIASPENNSSTASQPFEKVIGSKNREFNLKSKKKQSPSAPNNFYKTGLFNNQTSIENLTSDNSTTFLSRPVLLATTAIDKNLNKLSSNEHIVNGLKDFKLLSMDNCPSARGPVRNDLYIELYGSPDYARKTINNASSANAAFLQRKDSTENMRLSYTAGFRLTKTIGENLLVKAGLQYSQINEKFNYRSENERKLTTVITIRTVIRSAGDTIIVRDTSSVEQIGYRVKTTYNRYKSIDLPLLIGYEWGNDNFKAVVSGGVILNLYSWQKGESLDTSYVPVAFNKSSGQTFKQNIGLGLYAGISALKRVGEKTELFIEPYFRYNLSNMTNNKSLFNQKFQVAGMNMGLRYKLNSHRQR